MKKFIEMNESKNETLQALEQERERFNKRYRKGLIDIIELWLKNNARDLTTEELEKIVHFCNGGDAIRSIH
tara:strand:- start:33 stop:245 length:213 start_codon:yes stop_codon:yes gene_type:complete